MSATNFPDWRANIAGKKKLEQIMQTFDDVLDPSIRKYVCAPCFTCKLQIRDLFGRNNIWSKHSIMCGGLVELIVNAMTDLKSAFLKWDGTC